MHDNSNKSINVGGFIPVDLMEYGSLCCPRNQGIQKRNHLMFVLHFHGELDIQVFTVQILKKVTAFVNSIPRMCRSRIWTIYSVWRWLSVSLSVQNVPWAGKLTTVNTAAGSLSHQVYWKPAYTESYLNCRSFHHPSVLRSINSTLVRRAHNIVNDQAHLRHILECNGYPPHHIKSQDQPTWQSQMSTLTSTNQGSFFSFWGSGPRNLKYNPEGSGHEVRHFLYQTPICPYLPQGKKTHQSTTWCLQNSLWMQ